MKEKMKKIFNRHLKMLIIIGLVVVVAMGLLLMLISGNAEDRSQVEIDNPAAEEQENKKKKDRKLAEIGDHPGVSDTALNMYNARADEISDTAQVAQLLEASDMRTEMGGYLATVKTKDGAKVLVIAYEKVLKEGEETAFDELATWYAEQLLALIADADEIDWTYNVEKTKVVEESDEEASDEKDSEKDDSEKKESTKNSTKEKTEQVKELQTKSLTVKQANKLLNIDDIKSYSETPELVQTLMNNQRGIV